MGTKAREIVELDVEKLIAELNRAYADEWLAFYQYWISARVAQGRESKVVVEELKRVALEELEHAEELADRIIQLGGRPLTNPKEWLTKANCAYKEPPNDPKDVARIIKDAIEAERCAISVYNKLAETTHSKDHATYHLARHILDEELAHEDAFENML
ncbi:MAG: ferritin [Candidatus Acetothermia bacterium]|jgi:bacterioferritin|nr:ferritin [Candidatus Acetothermia bacterium]MDH7505089.1 ferritin-like domain-containing protein [Candidatus Acetothermia bacterium]